MDAAPRASVILCVRNGGDTLVQQLDALGREAKAATPWELLVVDNGSTDGSQSVVAAWLGGHPEVTGRLVDGSARPGLAAARNIGAGAARGELLLFCDADDEVQPGWVDAHVRALEDGDLAGGPVDTVLLNSPEVRSWRAALWPPDGTCLHENAYTGMAAPLGANMSVRASAYRAVGGCDERLRIASDELDLCWRMRLAGMRVVPAPGAVVAYRFRSDVRGLARQFRNYGRSEAILREKYRGQGIYPRLSLHREWEVARWLLGEARLLRQPMGPERADWIQRSSYRVAMWRGLLVLAVRRRLRVVGPR
ncbi:MAG: glycosyltransferase [Actinomycetota bacterium]|nr:glycosyltransferase [Actinomycetota bacterium]